MKYKKITLNDWYEKSFNCSSESLEFDEYSWISNDPPKILRSLIYDGMGVNDCNEPN